MQYVQHFHGGVYSAMLDVPPSGDIFTAKAFRIPNKSYNSLNWID